MGDDRLRVICGPTAAGKSAIALGIAARTAITIISADSRQIYRGFDIGTAKPAGADRERVPHRGIDVAEPEGRYSASRWAAEAERWVDEARNAGRIPLIAGGTGFYMRALFSPLYEEPAIDPRRRRALEQELGGWPRDLLARWCAAIDPTRAHLGRAQLTQAIVIALSTGRRISDWHIVAARTPPPLPRHRPRYLLIDPGAALGDRIARRVHEMLDAGWEDEVRRLERSVDAEAPAWRATGYGAVRLLVSGGIARDAAVHRIVVATRQYAKRQRTWFRNQLAGEDVTMLNPDDADAAGIVQQWWNDDDDSAWDERAMERIDR
ncbi:MAG: tRNA (adenosine(37)-N6)-dimethylallyltransferase MiaA [Gemmatimonadaceae bacterium]